MYKNSRVKADNDLISVSLERFLATLEMTIRESLTDPSHQSLIPVFKLFEDPLFRIVIPSAVLDLSCTQVGIT